MRPSNDIVSETDRFDPTLIRPSEAIQENDATSLRRQTSSYCHNNDLLTQEEIPYGTPVVRMGDGSCLTIEAIEGLVRTGNFNNPYTRREFTPEIMAEINDLLLENNNLAWINLEKEPNNLKKFIELIFNINSVDNILPMIVPIFLEGMDI